MSMDKKTYEKPTLKKIPLYTTIKVYTTSLKQLHLAAALSGETMVRMLDRIITTELESQKKKQAKIQGEGKQEK